MILKKYQNKEFLILLSLADLDGERMAIRSIVYEFVTVYFNNDNKENLQRVQKAKLDTWNRIQKHWDFFKVLH